MRSNLKFFRFLIKDFIFLIEDFCFFIFFYLKILLFRSDDPDSPLQVIPLTTSMVFFATIPRDNGKYFVRLETSLNPNVYERFRLDEIQFVANSSSNVLNLEFKPKVFFFYSLLFIYLTENIIY